MKRIFSIVVTVIVVCLTCLQLGGCTIETPEQYKRQFSGDTSQASEAAESSAENSQTDKNGSDTHQPSVSVSVSESSKNEPQQTSKNNATKTANTTSTGQVASTVSATTVPASPATTSIPLFCTISVRCDTILNNLDNLKEGKLEFVGNGIILAARSITFKEGESVLDVLLRAMQGNVDFQKASGGYVNTINHLGQRDCGSGSGWMYFVNGVKMGIGCSVVKVKSGDIIEWKFTCDGGNDVL